ncbi:hypothetical protein MIND_00423700 [Mycena indigotica]|uniref:Uncharacterized protein n=1 Tax=Mycena indigotica TaxID=2126181 RepID=A0A8H6SYN0_9AGAR|nr:uncharacterized protein MIND_00423700 [Mycena indigotica]KAF7306325.1 hypothetical protein MIND_00423700 [Mycena indigotica]
MSASLSTSKTSIVARTVDDPFSPAASDEAFSRLLGSRDYLLLVDAAVSHFDSQPPRPKKTRLSSVTDSDWMSTRAYEDKWPANVLVEQGTRKFCSVVCRALRAAGFHTTGRGEHEMLLAVLHDQRVLSSLLSFAGGGKDALEVVSASKMWPPWLTRPDAEDIFDCVAALLFLAQDPAVRQTCKNHIKSGLSDLLSELAIYITSLLVPKATATRREENWRAKQLALKEARVARACRRTELDELQISIEAALLAQQARDEGVRPLVSPPPPLPSNQVLEEDEQDCESDPLWVELFGPLESTRIATLGPDNSSRLSLCSIPQSQILPIAMAGDAADKENSQQGLGATRRYKQVD